MALCTNPGLSHIPDNICGNLLWLRGSVFPFTACFSNSDYSDPVFCVFVISGLAGYSQRKKQHVIRDYALSVVGTANKNCKVLWCIYLWLQDTLFGFNKLASQKFAHLNSSCLPYGSKLHLANGIIYSCPSDFHVQSYIWMFKGVVCWCAEGRSAEKCLFWIPVFFCFFFLFFQKVFLLKKT